MKKSFLSISILVLVEILLLTSCKNDNPSPSSSSNSNLSTTTIGSSQLLQLNDQAKTDDALNSVSDDINTIANLTTTLGGRIAGITLPASDFGSLIITDTSSGTINYSGTNKTAKYSRSGSVNYDLINGKWHQIGSSIIVTFKNLTFKKNSDSTSITINGSLTYYNMTGGTAYVPAYDSDGDPGQVTHKIYGKLTISYSDTSATAIATWNTNKYRIWAAPVVSNPVNYRHEGDTVISGYSNVSDFGVNRRGKSFIVSNPGLTVNNCGTSIAPVYRSLGTVKTYFLSGTLTIDFGAINSMGNLASTPCGGLGIYSSWMGASGNSVTNYSPY